MNELLKVWDATPILEDLVSEGGGGVSERVRPFTVAGLARRAPVTLVVLARSRDAEAFVEAMKLWVDPSEVALFPAWEVLPGEAMSPTLETMGRRLKISRDLVRGSAPPIVVSSVRALVQSLADPPTSTIRLVRGEEVSMDGTVERLVEFGFERNYLVERPGDFSV